MTRTATLSELLRHPNEVIERLEEGDVTITRRDGEALRLSKDARQSESQGAINALSRLIAASLDEDACDRLAVGLTAEHSWMEFLPVAHRRTFVGDYFRTARACAKAGAFQPLAVLVASWEATAEAYALNISPAGADLEYIAAEDAVVPDPRTA